MSILIKGMEMPKNCDECFFVGRGFPDWCSLPQIPKDEDEIDDTNNRPDWCPLEEVPSAQPEPLDEWCTDCKEYDHERHCCPRWNRVIRQTLKDAQPEPYKEEVR